MIDVLQGHAVGVPLLPRNDTCQKEFRGFLIEKYALVTVPAITLTAPEKVSVRENADALLGGLSKGDHPLPNVPKELEDIRAVTGGRVLLNEDFTIERLKDEFRGRACSDVLMATHGEFGSTPEETFLQTYDGKLTMDQLEELVSIGRFRGQHTDLLTLSACRTAQGDERAALGLAGVAVKAGVRSVIATLWSVADEAASVIVTEFYRQLETGIPKVRALQNAQRKLIAHPRFHHPAYWSPFLLIGNWT